MAVKFKFEPIDREVIAKLMGGDEEAQKRARAEFARSELRKAQEINKAALGRVPEHETFVDQRPGGREEDVRPDGMIVYEFRLLEDLFAWIGEELILRAPVGDASDPRPGHPGFFRASYAFFAGDTQIPMGAPVPYDADEYWFTNTAIYARKIEHKYSDQAPSGVFEVLAKDARARFGNYAQISFSYRQLHADGSRAAYTGKAALMAGGMTALEASAAIKAQKQSRQPAIIITPFSRR